MVLKLNCIEYEAKIVNKKKVIQMYLVLLILKVLEMLKVLEILILQELLQKSFQITVNVSLHLQL